ncbi:26S proteasome non-ATPase regulatory subunit 6 like protein, partial [Dictyocoela roeselum]
MDKLFAEPSLGLLKKLHQLKSNPLDLKSFIIDNNYVYLYKKYFSINTEIYSQAEYNAMVKRNEVEEQELVSSFNNGDDDELKNRLGDFYARKMDIEKFLNHHFRAKTDGVIFLSEQENDIDKKEMDIQLDDACFCLLRMAFIANERDLLEDILSRDLASDWDRRNKFKAYRALYLLSDRQYKEAANIFIDILPTYDSPELASFQEAQIYTLFSAIVGFDRAALAGKLNDFVFTPSSASASIAPSVATSNADAFINTSSTPLRSENASP